MNSRQEFNKSRHLQDESYIQRNPHATVHGSPDFCSVRRPVWRPRPPQFQRYRDLGCHERRSPVFLTPTKAIVSLQPSVDLTIVPGSCVPYRVESVSGGSFRGEDPLGSDQSRFSDPEFDEILATSLDEIDRLSQSVSATSQITPALDDSSRRSEESSILATATATSRSAVVDTTIVNPIVPLASRECPVEVVHASSGSQAVVDPASMAPIPSTSAPIPASVAPVPATVAQTSSAFSQIRTVNFNILNASDFKSIWKVLNEN